MAEKTGVDTSAITNEVARNAVDAWQRGDAKAWRSYFTDQPTLLDDGKPRDFGKLSTQTIGSEYFTSIDKVEGDGRDVYGRYHSDTWGDFKTYFKFTINADNEVETLEIGQADY